MTDESWRARTLDALKAVMCVALGGESVDQSDAAVLLCALADELHLDTQTQFSIGQQFIARAFAEANQDAQIERAGTIGDIASTAAEVDRLSPRDARPAHVPVEPPTDSEQLDVRRRYVRRVRQTVPGLEEREGVLGGYVSLTDLSQRRSEQTGEWAVYNPPALGLAHTVDGASLYELVRTRRLRLDGVEAQGYDEADSLRIRVSNPGRRVLVRIERGAVFERRLDDDIQNLSVRDEVVVWLNPGTHELTAFGLCMDQTASAPDGQPMLLTPWVLRRRVDSQDDLWGFTDRPTPEEDDQHAPSSAYTYNLFGQHYEAESQKDAFVSVFVALADRDPSFLESMVALYEDEKPEVVPVVARRRSDLPDWARGSSVELAAGFWLHTAMGGKVKVEKLREACEVADVGFGDPAGVSVDWPHSGTDGSAS